MKSIKQRDDYNTNQKCTWCPGCGNFAIWYMLKQALLELSIQPHEVVIVYDIGCAGNGANFTDVYAFHGLHGRALPVAEGIKFASNKLKVIVVSGDGGGMGIGVGHFLHACRRNVDITYIMHDNQIYGLTTGQVSPRSDVGMITKTSPEGNHEDPVNPLTLALDSNATFVGRAFSGNPQILKDVLKKAITHRGFALVDVLQPCVTFNKLNTYGWFNERVYDLSTITEYDATNKAEAWEKANEWGDRIPLGIFYQINKETYEDQLAMKVNPVEKDLSKPVDVKGILKKYEV